MGRSWTVLCWWHCGYAHTVPSRSQASKGICAETVVCSALHNPHPSWLKSADWNYDRTFSERKIEDHGRSSVAGRTSTQFSCLLSGPRISSSGCRQQRRRNSNVLTVVSSSQKSWSSSQTHGGQTQPLAHLPGSSRVRLCELSGFIPPAPMT